MIDRVYIITTGAYSDYHIDSVWTTREEAEKHIVSKASYVEEWLLNETQERELIEWRAWLHPSGLINVDEKPYTTASPQTAQVFYHKSLNQWSGNGFGPTPEHALKSLSDALAQAKAEALG